MKIVHILPGAGAMYCGNCFRDNALVGALRRLGHSATLVPLYLPLTLDEEDNSAGTPLFYGGINVYLEQESALYRSAPRWFKRILDHPLLMKWASGRAAKTRAADVGPLTISMLRGEAGNQASELDELIRWLSHSEQPEVICLSNALLVGLARKMKEKLDAPVVCFLQGEDSFLDALPPSHRSLAWETIAERAADIDLFIAPSHYFASLMRDRLGLATDRVSIVQNGLNLAGFDPAPAPPQPPVVGYFARMCREKGLDTLVEAFLLLKAGSNHPELRLHVGGSLGPGDRTYVDALRQKLDRAGLAGQYEFFPNLDRASKQAFYRSLSVMSVPARYGEAFGLYLIEALAVGVPVVQPSVAAFPELIERTGGGILCAPENPKALADGLDQLLQEPGRALALGRAGRKAVQTEFGIERMAERILDVYRRVTQQSGRLGGVGNAHPSDN